MKAPACARGQCWFLAKEEGTHEDCENGGAVKGPEKEVRGAGGGRESEAYIPISISMSAGGGSANVPSQAARQTHKHSQTEQRRTCS